MRDSNLGVLFLANYSMNIFCVTFSLLSYSLIVNVNEWCLTCKFFLYILPVFEGSAFP